VARYLGAPATIAIGGTACLTGALVFHRALPMIREQVRPVYRSLGILPEIAKEI
jgi:hypothetical protein